MLKKDKVNFIVTKLDEIYPEVSPPLNHHNNYTLLIAVLLSANTTDKSVNKVTPKLFQKADNPQKMSKLKYETVYNIIKPCGLGPAKTKAIIELSKILVKKYKGKVPNSFSDLESFPGVGHKTASVVMSQAFGVPAFPVDTHVHRLMYDGGYLLGKTFKILKNKQNDYFQKKNGTNYIFKSFFMDENIVQQRILIHIIVLLLQ
ncbi:MAG: endonuclease III [Candidatus Neomarinimicrobiota bacterium]|nr:MAG: endonuclease III [Candidatus Neomarinimicrobiota bacterium]